MKYENIAPHYQLVVTRENYSDALEVKVELVDGTLLENYAELENLRNMIHHDIKVILGIEVKVSLVEYKSLERFQGKAKRILDLRNS
jgi:phenylacetate-CoA ligase